MKTNLNQNNVSQTKINQSKTYILFFNLIVVALIASAFSTTVLAGVGKVQFAIGNVTAVGTDGVNRVLAKGADINNGDTIQTADGRAQVRFVDGGYMSFQPNTEFKVEDYYFSGQADGTEKGIFRLVKGSLRAITGLIGKTHKPAWRMNTPVATIGVRGTETLSEFKDGILRVTVGDGAAFLENSQGNLILYQGQTGETDGKLAPQYSTQEVKVSAAAPRKAGIGSTEHQKDAKTEVDEVDSATKAATNDRKDKQFSVADARESKSNNNGQNGEISQILIAAVEKKSTSLFEGGLAGIPQLSTLHAKAEYTATTPITFPGSGIIASTANLTSTLEVNFSNYEAEFKVQSDKFVGGDLDNKIISADTSATLNSATGAIPFMTAVLKTSGGGSDGLLTVNSAQLGVNNLSQANMTYTILEGVTGDTAIITNQVLNGELK